MRRLAVAFTNFGPYHLARLRALAKALRGQDAELIGYEMASREATYPWQTAGDAEPFRWVTLFADRVLEDLTSSQCQSAMIAALDRDRPDAVGVVGYARPESLAMLHWARAHDVPSVLMSESQAIDHPRTWWKEAVKRQRVRKFSAGLVGGPRHRDYLISLGMRPDRITLGYNAVDGAAFAARADACRRDPRGRVGLPDNPYFLAVSRFVPEKNIERLIGAYSQYRRSSDGRPLWDLVLCGDGPGKTSVEAAVRSSGFASSIHRPGFLQMDEIARWYAFASAFVHPSLMEPWGLVVNEAAACGLALLVSDRCGCVDTFVPHGLETTGRRFDGRDVEEIANAMSWMASLGGPDRAEMGRRAAEIAREWGPERFAQGTLEALRFAEIAAAPRRRRVVELTS